MLEIILLVWLCKKMGRLMTSKGRRATWYQVMVVVMWFVGEILGVTTGAMAFADGTGEINALAYLMGIVGAIAGVSVAFIIANTRTNLNSDAHRPKGFGVVLPAGRAP